MRTRPRRANVPLPTAAVHTRTSGSRRGLSCGPRELDRRPPSRCARPHPRPLPSRSCCARPAPWPGPARAASGGPCAARAPSTPMLRQYAKFRSNLASPLGRLSATARAPSAPMQHERKLTLMCLDNDMTRIRLAILLSSSGRSGRRERSSVKLDGNDSLRPHRSFHSLEIQLLRKTSTPK